MHQSSHSHTWKWYYVHAYEAVPKHAQYPELTEVKKLKFIVKSFGYALNYSRYVKYGSTVDSATY